MCKDQPWICTQDAGKRNGTSIYAFGRKGLHPKREKNLGEKTN